MPRRIIRAILPALLAAVVVLAVAAPVYAIANPASTTMPSVKAFQNIFETGDMLFLCEYNVYYPTDTAVPTFVAAGAVADAASGNVTPALPAGWAANDIFICAVASLDNVVPTLPAGWTAIDAGTINGAGFIFTAYYRRAVAGDTAPLVTHAAGAGIAAVVVAYRGCAATGIPIDVLGYTSVNTPASTTLTFHSTGITTTINNDLVVCLGGVAGQTTSAVYTGSPSPTERVDGPNLAARPEVVVADFPKAIAGATGSRQSTILSFVSNGILLALRPAAGAEPTQPASATFLMSVYGAGGTPLIQSAPLNSYQTNIQSIYFNPTQAAALVWGSAYAVKVMGNPIYFPTLTEGTNMATVALSLSQWIADGTQTSKAQLKTYCLDLAADLESAWGVTLIVSTPDGDKLNNTGYTTFVAAIPGINSPLPDLFQISTSTYQIESVPSTGTFANSFTMAGQLGAATTAAFNGIGAYLGVSGQMAASMWILLFMLVVASIVFMSSGNVAAAMVLVVPIAIIGVIVGVLPMALLFTVTIVVVVYMGYFLWLRGM